MPKRTGSRVDLTIKQKVAKLDAYHALCPNARKWVRDAASHLNVSRSALRPMLQKKNELRASVDDRGDSIRNRAGKDVEVEEAVFKWWQRAVEKKIPLNGALICSKAESIAEKIGHLDFKATDG